MDQPCLSALQRRFARHTGPFCGYGVATPDFGVFDSPDAFYARHGVNLSGLKAWLYQHGVRHSMNRNVERVRTS